MTVPTTLSPAERTVLHLMALMGPPAGKKALAECLTQARVSTPSTWRVDMLTPILATLQRHGLLDEKHACAPALAQSLAVEALAAPSGKALAAAIRIRFPATSDRPWDFRQVEIDLSRALRLAVLVNDGAEFQRIIAGARAHVGDMPPLFDQYFALVPVGVDWFASRPPLIQVAVLGAKSRHWVATGDMAPDLPDLIAHCRKDETLRVVAFPMIADFLLLSGRLADLATYVAEVPTDGTLAITPEASSAFAAAQALLSGDVPQAVTLFTQALAARRKATRTRKGGLPGYLGVLHLCALLASDDAALQPVIASLLQGRSQSTAEVPLGQMAVEALADLISNRQDAAVAGLKWTLGVVERLAQPSPFSLGLVAAATVVIDPSLARPWRQMWEMEFRRLAPTMPVAADMLAEALERVSPKPAPYRAHLDRPDRETRLRFAALIPVKEPWERALESLEAMLEPAAPAVPKATGGKRLAWLVTPETGEIEPVEQVQQRGPTKSPTQGWSRGRPVALKRLHQADAALTYLDDFDRRVIATIERQHDGWGGYGRYEFHLPPRTALPALVGHPRVFAPEAPHQPVELVEGRVELVLAACRGGFRLTLSPPVDQPDAVIEVETPSRWRVVVIDKKAVAAGQILGLHGITVPAAARDRLTALARRHLPDLPVRVEAAELDDGLTETGDPAPVVRLSPLGQGLKVALVVRPLGPEGPHFLPGLGSRRVGAAGRQAQRDLKAEQTRARALAEACPSLGGEGPEWELDSLDASLEFLAELKALPDPPALEWPEGQSLTLHGEASASRFNATVKGTESWFALSGSVTLDEGLVLDLKDLLARLEETEGRFIPLGEGQFVALDHHFRQQLERLRRLGGLKVPRAAGTALRDLVEEAGTSKMDAAWRDFIRRLDEAEAWQPQVPATVTAELRDYQHQGFVWMSRLARWGAGALLADDMGLGKTVQAIAVMAAKASDGPILVVAPTSVAGNWQAEVARFAPGLTTHRLAETGGRDDVLKALGPGDVLVTTYGLLVREEARLAALPWAMAVLDEAQAIKNADTRRAKAAQSLTAGFRLALTGTPVENDLDELWSLFQFVNPGLLGSREAFTKRFATPIQVARNPGARAALRALVRPFLLRRTKATVLAELPPRTEQTLLIERGAEEGAFYEALRRRALEKLEDMSAERSRLHILAEITRLRQACCHPDLVAADANLPSAKLEAFLELVEELREGGHRALVFSQFVGHLSRVRAALDAAGVTYQFLDGSTPAAEREKRVAAFQAGDGALFLISLKAGGFGLNLTAADYVIHLDPWWNPAVEDQASDRAHRIGQRRPVTIYRLILKGTIEEGILALHGRKRDLAGALLEDTDTAGRLSEEELLGLIQGMG
ncbi:DEAD/DEAH box helicase [Nitrospirillum iridis]|uniref:Superfamily II DNA or RNA helicase n=1 Tax=Nitrospirillum iridis TaxID=765888 RepID=A0A7X0AY29_9PROT|nr:DEAD/DEAH box helicase [Nitrospirillum iridis]MBB6252243.1 superfamily II DNA or RNA helicase [Nitrospirillum iridis]